MKTRVICGLLLVAGLAFLSSCSKKNDAKPPVVVGTWNLDSYYFTNIPDNFNGWEGQYKGTFFGEQSNTLTINTDKTYTWRIAYDGPDFNDAGKWELTTTQLNLNSTASTSTDFKIEQDITTDQMLISQIESLTLLPNSVADTLTTAEWNDSAFLNTVYTKFGQSVDVTVVSLYEK